MNSKTKAMISGLACIIFAGSSVAFAMETVSTQNHVETGVVDIELTEYQKGDNGELELYDYQGTLMPKDKISKIPRILNVGYDCYVRAKLDFTMDEFEDSYYGMPEEWVYRNDGYWYYTEILSSGNYVDIFQGFIVPEDLNQELEGEDVALHIDVDAIQTKNFIPDYESTTPWGTIEIQECIHEGPHTINSLTTGTPLKFELQYSADAKKLILNEDEVFANFPTLFPGDVYEDVIELKNNGDKPIKLYFHTYSKESDLIDNIKLSIKLVDGFNETLIYDGSLHSEKLKDEMLLTNIKPGKSQKLVYKIEIPAELDNQYTLLEDEVRWMFTTLEEGDKTPVPTGDVDIILPVVGMVTGIAIMLFLAVAKKKEETEKK